jgi:hypothetical protein
MIPDQREALDTSGAHMSFNTETTIPPFYISRAILVHRQVIVRSEYMTGVVDDDRHLHPA